MMYRRNKIQKWIADGEGPNLDFKQKITSPSKIARSIVAFANSRGGKIVVGVEDHGHIIGVDVGGEEYELLKAAKDFCKPAIELDFETYEMQGKMLLIAYVEESYQKPHYAIDKKKREKIYVRIQDECVVPNEMISNALLKGEMNDLERNFEYTKLRMELINYLKKYGNITIADYMRLKACSERNAIRALLDFWFEGAIRSRDDGKSWTL